jgi:GH15 family glucan-1,4-alpha-glucosidase
MASIGDLAFLSDSRTAALIDREGSVVWYCPVRFDSPAVFASMLDADAGHWRVAPLGDNRAQRRYDDDGLVLRTRYDGPDGSLEATDCLALPVPAVAHEIGRDVPHALVRTVTGIAGRMTVEMELVARFEYGLTLPQVERLGPITRLTAGPLALALRADVDVRDDGDRLTARFEVGVGDSVAFVLSAYDPHGTPPEIDRDGRQLVETTRQAWAAWSAEHRGYDGEAVDLVRRSALVLQGLTDARTGAVVAAATTSLPEIVGDEWNWDYRYAWLRDLAFVMRALWVAACPDEADRFLRFLTRSLGRAPAGRVPIVLGSDGRRDLTEHVLPHLRGFRGSTPVRVGNDAWSQSQLDVLGEVLDSAHLLRERIGTFGDEIRELLIALTDRAAAAWRDPDAGMWEARDRERQYTSSKVMCWVALDRGIALADQLGGEVPVARWRAERDAVREVVLRDAWSERAGAFAGAFGSEELDASVLLMPLVGFLPADDARMAATIDAVAGRLTSGPLVHRWADDPNGFLLCSYWLVECEALLGRAGAARARFGALNALANDLGLLTEMAERDTREALGNVPQAFSHIGQINAAWRLTQVGRGGERAPD